MTEKVGEISRQATDKGFKTERVILIGKLFQNYTADVIKLNCAMGQAVTTNRTIVVGIGSDTAMKYFEKYTSFLSKNDQMSATLGIK